VRSTILTSQLPVSRWHEQIGDPTLADGILDRLVHNAHRVEIQGDSIRKLPTTPLSGASIRLKFSRAPCRRI
jgi:hypothetical protein